MAKLEEILALKRQGLNQSQIAERLGCSQSHISHMSTRHGIYWDKGAGARDQRGEKNPNFQGGMGRSTIERLTRNVVLASGRSLFICERCGTRQVNQEHPRHHKDRNRSNNHSDNIEVLCTACHNSEHMNDKIRDPATGRFVT